MIASDAHVLVKFLLDSLADGGSAAVICNTVAAAQARYTALREAFDGVPAERRPELSLFHARFPFENRQQRECQALQRFGKEGAKVTFPNGSEWPVCRPERAVIVATQVIEQSLDLDFDVMVTEVAPIDLILQRLGRLHRHVRVRSSRLSSPRIVILEPKRSNAGTWDFGVSAFVYAEHVLLKSWLLLAGRQTFRLPEDLDELVEAVYESRKHPDGLEPVLAQQWSRSLDEMAKSQAEDATQAESRWLPKPNSDRRLYDFTRNPQEEDDPGVHKAFQAQTRLTEPQVTVIPLWGIGTRVFLDREGTREVSLDNEPKGERALDFLRREVVLTNKSVVCEMLNAPPPSGWVKSPWLRHHRVLKLDPTGHTRIGNRVVTLDDELGVVVDKMEDVAG